MAKNVGREDEVSLRFGGLHWGSEY
jgi:hypothetical protein